MNKESEFDYLRFLSRTIPTTIFARPTMASKEKPQASIHQPPCHPLLPALGHSIGYYTPAELVSARNLAFSYCHRLRRSFDVRYRVDIPCGALKYNSVLLAR